MAELNSKYLDLVLWKNTFLASVDMGRRWNWVVVAGDSEVHPSLAVDQLLEKV